MNVFVTGGSRGIGRDIVIRFAREGWGVAFSFAGNEAAAAETRGLAETAAREAGRDCMPIKSYQLNLRRRADIERVTEQLFNDFGEFHALVNNAAIVRNNVAVLMSDEDWDDVIAVNLTGPFILMRAFTMRFIPNRFGRIVNISSLAEGGCSGQSNYAASKAGLVGLTLTFAKEYGPKGITSNAVTVGYVPTDMTKDNMADELHKYWMKHCPMKRPGKGEEIADLVHFLCSERGGFINGERIRVSGGLTYAP
jgi:3-oxoacyl-[acyl-carrier protein] reductase